MESELQKQHQTIRKKLDIHKEALRRMSPERDSVSPERGYSSPDREQRSPVQDHRSPVDDQRSPIREKRSPPVRDNRSPGREHRSPVPDRRSLEKDTVYSVRGHVSAERISPVRSQRSPERSHGRRSRSADGSLERQGTLTSLFTLGTQIYPVFANSVEPDQLASEEAS